MKAIDRLRTLAKTRPPTETERALAVCRSNKTQQLPRIDIYRPGATAELRAVQLEALLELARYGGLLGLIGVGHGKTLISLLAATVLDAERPVYMCPPGLVPVVLEEAGRFGSDFRIRSDISIIPYSLLSRPEHAEILNELRPDLLVLDEAHHLRHMTSARTKRVLRYLLANPTTRVVVLSGTLTSRSLRDYAHLAEAALEEQSPIPRSGADLSSWAAVLDADGSPTGRDWGVVRPLVDSFGEPGARGREAARAALLNRLEAAPGVILTRDASASASLVIRKIKAPAVPQAIQSVIAEVYSDGATPDGERVFATDEEASVCARQLSLGFFYSWDWHGVKEHTRIQWLAARSAYSAGLHAVLAADAPGLDSPSLVEAAAAEIGHPLHEQLPRWFLDRLWRWREIEPQASPRTITTWLDSFLVRDAVAWAQSAGEPVILWYRDQAVADKLEELGIRVYRGGETPPRTAVLCALSVAAHGQGFNLQPWRACRVIGAPSSGKTWEQLIGRTHRAGQAADVVVWDIYQHAEGERNALRRAIEDARYVEQTTGQRQKLRLARYLEGRGGSLADL